MKRQLLILMTVCLAFAVNAQTTVTDVFSSDDDVFSGLGSKATIVDFTGSESGFSYGLRCTKVDGKFNLNGSATGHCIWSTEANGYYIRKITFYGTNSTTGTLRIKGSNTEWEYSSGYPKNVTSTANGKDNYQTIGSPQFTGADEQEVEMSGDYEYVCIVGSATAGDAAQFTGFAIEWEAIDESDITCTGIKPASGTTIERDANTFTISFSGAVTMYNGEGYYDKDGTKNDDGDYQGSYFIDYSNVGGGTYSGAPYAAFATMSPESGTYSDTWTVTIDPAVLAAWPSEEAEVSLRLITYAYTRATGTSVSTIFDEDMWCTASYTVAGSTWEVGEVPDMYTEYDVAEGEDYYSMDVLRSVKVYCDAGIAQSNYNFNDDDGNLYHSPEDIYVINDSGETVTTCGSFDYVSDNCMEVTFAKAVKDKGDFTIVIPAYCFALGEDTGNHFTTAYNDEYRVTITIDGTQEGMLDYVITPADGSIMGSISEVTVTFDGEVEWDESMGGYANVTIDNGSFSASQKRCSDATEVKEDGKIIGYTFKHSEITETGTYVFTIPASFIKFVDSGKVNDAITATYQVYEGMKSAGEVVVYDKVAYVVGDNGTVGVGLQAIYSDYEGVDNTGEITIPATIVDALDTGDVPYTVVGIAANAFRPYTTFDEESGNYQFNESCINTTVTKITLDADITDYGWAATSANAASGTNFGYCQALTEVVIGENVTTLGESMFNNCTSLPEITFPEGITELSYAVIGNCTSLTTVYIPSTCTAVGGRAFSADTKLTDIYCYAAVPPTTVYDGSGFTFNGCNQAMTLHVGCQYVDDYTESEYWVEVKTTNGYGITMEAVGYDCDYQDILAAVDELQDKADAVYQTAEEEYYTDDYIADTYATICGEIAELTATIVAGGYEIDDDTAAEYYAQMAAIEGDITTMSNISESYNNYFTYYRQISTLNSYSETIATAIAQLGEEDSYGEQVETIAGAISTWYAGFTEEAAAKGELVYDTDIKSIIDDYYAQYAEILEAAEEEYYETTDSAISSLDTELAEVWEAISEDTAMSSDPEVIEIYTDLNARISVLEEKLTNAKDNDQLEETAEEIQTEIADIQSAIDELIKRYGITTGITTIDAALAAQKSIYTIAGQKVSNATKAGLYIIDGKKVIVK